MKLEVVTDGRFDQGWELIKALDAAGFPIKAAFWSPVDGAEDWRLFIASPLVDQQGSLKAYQFIQAVLAKLPANGRPVAKLALSDISVIGLKSNLFREVKARASWAVRKGAKKLNPDFEDLLFLGEKLIYKLN